MYLAIDLTAMKRIYLLSVLISVSLFVSCSQEKKENDKLYVVTTTGMIQDALKNIAQDKAEVVGLMGPGVDPHLYKPTPGDLTELRKADIIFYNGLHLEGKMSEVFEQLARKKPVIPIASALDKTTLQVPQDGSQAYDPHIWFNVSLWKEAIAYAGKELSKVDKDNSAFYAANTQQFTQALDTLHTWVKEEINTIPEKQRVLITAHDAFGYFGTAYTIKVKGLQGISTLSEFGLRDVSELVNFIVDNNIKAVFVETSVSSKSLETVVSGCQEKGHEVKIGGTLYSDAMGQAGTPEGTYFGMVKANVNTIVSSLK